MSIHIDSQSFEDVFVGHHFSSQFRLCFQGNAPSIKRSFSTQLEAQKVDGAYADVTRKHLNISRGGFTSKNLSMCQV